jgi:sugar phosphate isomerase/epimerase
MAGLSDYVPRFFNMGTHEKPEIKGLLALSPDEVERVVETQKKFGFTAHCLGSPVGKGVKVAQFDDTSQNRWVEPREYFEDTFLKTLKLANAFGARMIRGFSFHQPHGQDSKAWVDAAVERLRTIVDVCGDKGVIYAIEVETNLVGDCGETCEALMAKLNSPWCGLVFDFGNVASQGDDIYQAWTRMKPWVVSVHIKHYVGTAKRGEVVDENALRHYAPITAGTGALRAEPIFAEIAAELPELAKRVWKPGICGFPLVLEPHVKGGGKFGGISGPNGMGVALRELERMLEHFGIPYELRGWEDVRRSRGF